MKTSYSLGEPEELFYWGPTHAQPIYMSDFMTGIQDFFLALYSNSKTPKPPKSLVLFHGGKMVWLSNNQAFADFTESMFDYYILNGNIASDYKEWRKLNTNSATIQQQIEAWGATFFAEFALYGAQVAIEKKISRLDEKNRQEVWSLFSTPDKRTFLHKIDEEIGSGASPLSLAKKYPWINDGYSGISNNAESYFSKRSKDLSSNKLRLPTDQQEKRDKLAENIKLTQGELDEFTLARKLAEFMDERKAWMMKTRRNISKSTNNIEHGWLYDSGRTFIIESDEAENLWRYYIDFKSSGTDLTGIVASNGGKDFVEGIVRILTSPTDSVPDNMVLVVPSTSPSYVHLMRKAKALITDHGGIMSHAAIVAREFNLPCLVGTREGTKVLKDGDKIIIDLVLGTIKRKLVLES